jgi:hypothetical protein
MDYLVNRSQTPIYNAIGLSEFVLTLPETLRPNKFVFHVQLSCSNMNTLLVLQQYFHIPVVKELEVSFSAPGRSDYAVACWSRITVFHLYALAYSRPSIGNVRLTGHILRKQVATFPIIRKEVEEKPAQEYGEKRRFYELDARDYK